MPSAAAVCQHCPGTAQLHARLAGLACSAESPTFAIEPIRAAYAGPLDLSSVLLKPYGPVTGTTCLLVLTLLTAALFLLIRPLLNRKLA